MNNVQTTTRRRVKVLVVLLLLVGGLFAGNVVVRWLFYKHIVPRPTTGFLIKNLDLACLCYYNDWGNYPPEGGDALFRALTSEVPREGAPSWGPYMTFEGRELNRSRSVIVDQWGRPIRYFSPGKNNSSGCDLWSAGLDGIDGTQDDITNWEGRRR